MAETSRERLGSVTIGGRRYAVNAKINRPSAATMRASGGIGQFSIDVSTRGLANNRQFGLIDFTVNKKTRTASVRWISSDPSLKGQGVGNRLYARAMLEAKQQGATKFNSDARVSPSAIASWESLRKKLPAGAVTRNAAVDQSSQPMAGPGLYAPSGAVFSVDLRKVSKSQLTKMIGNPAPTTRRTERGGANQTRRAMGSASR